MSRDDGFAIADVSTSHHEDTKVKAMWRGLRPDESAMNAAMTLHEAVRLASWRDGKRVFAWQAKPEWMPDHVQPMDHLIAADLLDRTGRLPKAEWERMLATRVAVRAGKRRRKLRRRAAQHGIVMVISIHATECGVCQRPLTKKRFPHPMSTTIGHEPPLATASRDGWIVVVERPEHYRCNLAKGIKTDAELAAR